MPIASLLSYSLVVIAAVIGTVAPVEARDLSVDDYLYYGIFLKQRGDRDAVQILDLRYGDPKIQELAHPEFRGRFSERPRVAFRLRDGRNVIQFRRVGNDGVTVSRETFNEKTRQGTKLLAVSLSGGTCRVGTSPAEPCDIALRLTATGADRGVVRPPRRLEIATSTGFSRTYRSAQTDGFEPFDRGSYLRSVLITNFAIEYLADRLK